MHHARYYGLSLALAGTLMVFGGCNADGDQSCDYWVSQLDKGKKEKQSIEKVGELKCEAAIDSLHKRFPDTLYRREMLATLDKLGKSEKAVEMLTWALPDKEVGPLAIQLGIKWQVESLKADLSKLIRKQRSASTRLQALEALVDLMSPKSLIVGEGENGTLTFHGKAGRRVGVIQLIDIADEKHKELPDGVSVNGEDILIKVDFAKGATVGDIAGMITIHNDASELVKAEPSGDGSGKLQAMRRGKPLGRVVADPTLIDTLSWVVGQEPTLQGVDTNQWAADRLREVEWKTIDDAKATEVAQNLVKALFMRDAKGNSAQINARFALRVIGPPAVEPILTAFQGINKELNEFAEIRGLPRWKYTQGHELVEMLWDVGDKRASPALMKAMGIPLNPPPPDVARLPEDQRTEWKTANSNRLTTTALTVGSLPNDDAVKYAVELLKRKNPPPEVTQFVQAGLGLALMGTDASRAAMWQLFEEGGDLEALRTEIKALRESCEKMPKGEKQTACMRDHDTKIDTRTGLETTRANFITNLAVGLSTNEVSKFEKQVAALEKGPIAEAGKQPLPRAYFQVVKDCGKKFDCYSSKLTALSGKLDEIPKAIEKAQKTVITEKARVAEKAKPITVRIKAANKGIKAKLKLIMDTKKQIEAVDAKKKPEKAELEARNKHVEAFNTGLDEYNAMREAIDKIYLERNEVLKELAPFNDAVRKEMEKIHQIEKVALVIGNNPEGAAHLKTLLGLFAEAKHPAFTQFRQWSMISIEHLADKQHVEDLEDLLAIEKGEDGNRTTFWTLRLDSIVQRVKRR
ncbi:MAG: hypothetical protein ACI9WU_001913 [Myxococcota bacterium]|jgi:hypothetical protein